MGFIRSFSHIVDFTDGIDPAEILAIVEDTAVKVVQTTSMPDPAAWGLLNTELFSRRPDIELRAYGFFNEVCDLSFLEQMSYVRRFSVNCLQTVTNIEALGSMPQLEALTVGVYGLNSFEFLKTLPAEQIHTLSLEATESKKPEVSAPFPVHQPEETIH